MRRYTVSGLLIVALMSIFWAYTIVDTLLRKFSKEITWVDLGAIFVLGLISGGAFGLAENQPRPGNLHILRKEGKHERAKGSN
jgi:hypothetical protein